jgi:CheY-like chemotaxis protein
MLRVLLAEDDPGIRNAYAFALGKEGFEVALAASGAEALVRVQDQTFDVILLDMLMLGMSGLDFLRAYDVRKKSPGTKVIALTNFSNPEIEERAEALGVVGYLNKSEYEPRDLVTYLKRLLGDKIVEGEGGASRRSVG